MGQKLTDRTALATTPDNADLLYIVDVDDTTDDATGTSKQITVANLLAAATVPDASTTTKGKVELATDVETITGTDTDKATTPSNITAAAPTFIATSINSATGKTTPVDNDLFGIVDSAASNVLKKLTWANTKATLKTYFDTLYLTATSTISQRINPRVNTITSSATPAINTDTTDVFTITALAVAITSMTSSLTGTPVDGQKLIIRIKDNGTARAITWGASFANRGATLPTTTVLSKVVYVGLMYNSAASIWDCIAVSQEV